MKTHRSLALPSVPTVLLIAGVVLGSASPSAATGGHPAPTPEPQDPIETVFSTNASNDRLLRLDFRTGTAAYVNTDADARIAKRLEGIAVRDDVPGVSVIAADSVGQRILFYPDAQGPDRVNGQVIATIPWPDGVSLDSKGNLFLVTSPVGPKVWMLPTGGTRPGGYGDPVLVDPAVPATILEDTKPVAFTAGTLEAGDLLVLSRVPATVFRYRKGATGWERQEFVPKANFPKGASPTGMSFSPRQELLVSTLAGTILRFDVAGQRVLPDFAKGCGQGRLKIAVGIQEGKSRAFVANRSNGGKVLRFLIQPDGTGLPDGNVNEKVCLPNGVGIASNSAVPTPTGTNVQVKPAPEVEITYDVVNAPGLTGTRLVEFVDNRSCPDYACDQSLKAFFTDDPKLQASLPDVTVPAWLQALRKHLSTDPPGHSSGPPTFLLAIIKTTAGFQRTAVSHYEEEERGIVGECAPPGPQPQPVQDNEPRSFYAPETGAPKLEPGLVEGETFIDVSDGCGSNKASGWNFSLYLTGREPSTPLQIMDRKIPGLRLAFNSMSAFIASPTVEELDGHLADAEAAFAQFRDGERQADKDATLAALEAFRATADANVGSFDNAGAGRNVYGELVARTNSALFILPKAPVAPEPEPFSITIGDNDGYANAFGLQSYPVPDDGKFPSKLIRCDDEYVPRDGRGADEKTATNGAQQTDFYSALFPASRKYPIGLPSTFDIVFPVQGTITEATFEVDMGSFQATECSQIGVSINGVPQPGFFAFNDGKLNTKVRRIPLSAAQLLAANQARPVKITLTRAGSTDRIAFDYFKLSGKVIP